MYSPLKCIYSLRTYVHLQLIILSNSVNKNVKLRYILSTYKLELCTTYNMRYTTVLRWEHGSVTSPALKDKIVTLCEREVSLPIKSKPS